MNLQKEIMYDLYWAFNIPVANDLTTFKEEVVDYYEEVSGEGFPFDVDEIVIPTNSVVIQYIKYTEDDEEEPYFQLQADDSNGFKMGEILFKIHQHVFNDLKDDDAVFFEGLQLGAENDDVYPESPLYFMNLGS